mmetsp:Transcript_47470/g.110959  ORF Transcript_47470/g.110959 Transcript_47470/m.110959 type:complete len:235 (+) Transcript_47470:87-791(+)
MPHWGGSCGVLNYYDAVLSRPGPGHELALGIDDVLAILGPADQHLLHRPVDDRRSLGEGQKGRERLPFSQVIFQVHDVQLISTRGENILQDSIVHLADGDHRKRFRNQQRAVTHVLNSHRRQLLFCGLSADLNQGLERFVFVTLSQKGLHLQNHGHRLLIGAVYRFYCVSQQDDVVIGLQGQISKTIHRRHGVTRCTIHFSNLYILEVLFPFPLSVGHYFAGLLFAEGTVKINL